MLSLDNATDPFMRAALELAESEDLGFQIKEKSKSRLMWFLNRFARLFNPRWMEGFHVALGSTIYLTRTPEQAMAQQRQLVPTILHEMTHVYDKKKAGLRFGLSYAMPQILGLIAAPFLLLPALLVFAAPTRTIAWVGLVLGLLVSVVGWALICPWVIATSVGVFALFPWPSPWRVRWERRAYKMTMAAQWWMYGEIRRSTESLGRNFYGYAYYRMAWDKEKVHDFIQEDAEQVRQGRVPEVDSWFGNASDRMWEAKGRVEK